MTWRELGRFAIAVAAVVDCGSAAAQPISGRVGEVAIVSIEGDLPAEKVLRIIAKHQNELRYCYAVEVAVVPGLRGELVVALAIDPLGAATQPTIQHSTLPSRNVESCVLRKIGRWQFPEPSDGKSVAVSFSRSFSPRDAFSKAELDQAREVGQRHGLLRSGSLRPGAYGLGDLPFTPDNSLPAQAPSDP